LTGKFDLTNVNNMAFYISGPKLLFETTEISTHPNSTQQESNYIYLYTTKFGTLIKIWPNWKFKSTEFETMRVNCTCLNSTSFCNKFYTKMTFSKQPPVSYDLEFTSLYNPFHINLTLVNNHLSFLTFTLFLFW
jgi:hypothetical protein